MKPITQYVFEFKTIEEEEDVKNQGDKTTYIKLRMRESEVLCKEVLAHDLFPYAKGMEISVEEMITIVYLDFNQNVKSEGNSLKVQKSILSHLAKNTSERILKCFFICRQKSVVYIVFSLYCGCFINQIQKGSFSHKSTYTKGQILRHSNAC